MKILFLSCYPTKYFDKLVNDKINIAISIQKFSRLLLKGFHMNGVNVSAIIPSYPRSYSNNGYFTPAYMIVENDVNYYFMPKLEIPKVNGLISHLYTKYFVKKWCKENSDAIVIIDPLRERAFGISAVCKKLNIKNIVLVTDILNYQISIKSLSDKMKLKIRNLHNTKIINNATYFIFLTKYMNLTLNKENKPYIILQGIVEKNNSKIKKHTTSINKKQICLYSGKVNKSNGVPMLVEAFIKASIDSCELHIYGNGTYSKKLKSIAVKHPNIKFFGVVHNDKVVEAQIYASLLVNPRPSNQEYTKYSFPSKNLEYMISGTPCLLTKLPCIPESYYDKSYYIEDESIDGISQKLKEVLSKDKNELKRMGEYAKSFVIQENNFIHQAEKIIDLINN